MIQVEINKGLLRYRGKLNEFKGIDSTDEIFGIMCEQVYAAAVGAVLGGNELFRNFRQSRWNELPTEEEQMRFLESFYSILKQVSFEDVLEQFYAAEDLD